MKYKPIIIVAGQPTSIFFEIFFKSYKKKKYKSPLILICNKKIFINQMKYFNFNHDIRILKIEEAIKKNLDNKKIYLIDIDLKENLKKDYQAKLTKNYIELSFKVAFTLIRKGLTNKLVNGPINKNEFLNKKFLGVTEYIANDFNKKNIGMLIYNKRLSVCPLTTHLPIKKVAKNITKKLISQKIDLINNFYKDHLKIKAKIAVTGLNPHCESIFGNNEDETIIPSVIRNKSRKGIYVKGPYPADTIFLKANRRKFNVILGMYHDQVLGPLKTLFEYDAINITLGLPIIRVSPDHGPNVMMIGKNKSSELSLIKALEFLDSR